MGPHSERDLILGSNALPSAPWTSESFNLVLSVKSNGTTEHAHQQNGQSVCRQSLVTPLPAHWQCPWAQNSSRPTISLSAARLKAKYKCVKSATKYPGVLTALGGHAPHSNERTFQAPQEKWLRNPILPLFTQVTLTCVSYSPRLEWHRRKGQSLVLLFIVLTHW